MGNFAHFCNFMSVNGQGVIQMRARGSEPEANKYLLSVRLFLRRRKAATIQHSPVADL
jgi:hypothetical protein